MRSRNTMLVVCAQRMYVCCMFGHRRQGVLVNASNTCAASYVLVWHGLALFYAYTRKAAGINPWATYRNTNGALATRRAGQGVILVVVTISWRIRYEKRNTVKTHTKYVNRQGLCRKLLRDRVVEWYLVLVTCHLSQKQHQTLGLKPLQCAAATRITGASNIYLCIGDSIGSALRGRHGELLT